ncbi:MAG: phosphatidylglycerophosphatase A family protein [Gammaproteobacteria bacterium]
MNLKPASGSRQRVPSGFLRRPAHLVASGFGIGLVRLAPGTFGTLIGVGLYFGMVQLPVAYYGATVIVLFLLGILVCERTTAALGAHDDPSIVWDEVVGYLITMTAVPPQWIWIAIGFALFRIFDILKPWPVRAIDQHVGGGFGVMLDDALAGAYASIGVQTAMFLTQ